MAAGSSGSEQALHDAPELHRVAVRAGVRLRGNASVGRGPHIERDLVVPQVLDDSEVLGQHGHLVVDGVLLLLRKIGRAHV